MSWQFLTCWSDLREGSARRYPMLQIQNFQLMSNRMVHPENRLEYHSYI